MTAGPKELLWKTPCDVPDMEPTRMVKSVVNYGELAGIWRSGRQEVENMEPQTWDSEGKEKGGTPMGAIDNGGIQSQFLSWMIVRSLYDNGAEELSNVAQQHRGV
jgi:hypothetical protein